VQKENTNVGDFLVLPQVDSIEECSTNTANYLRYKQRYIKGDNLRQFLNQHKNEKDILCIFIQLVFILTWLHKDAKVDNVNTKNERPRFIHSDIRLPNIVIEKRKEDKIELTGTFLKSVRNQLINLLNDDTNTNNNIYLYSFKEQLRDLLTFKIHNFYTDTKWILNTHYKVYLIDWEQFENIEIHNESSELCNETISFERGLTCVKKLLLNRIKN
jgi:hypothetical protein